MMPNKKEMIRLAMLGDHEAQEECTEKRIALPCPLCRKEDSVEILDCYTAEGIKCESESFRKNSFKCLCNYLKGGCGTSTGVSETKQEALHKWNTRPAPPVGRCGECKYFNHFFNAVGHCMIHSQEKDSFGDRYRVEMLKTDFCSYFEPREE